MPKKSKMPIIASIEAAVTDATPKSAQSEMKWVWIRPLVLNPQMKKVPASTQNAPLPETSRKTRNAVAERGRQRQRRSDLAGLAIRNKADVGGAVDHEQEHRDRGDGHPDQRRRQRPAPAVMALEPCGQRQKGQLAGRGTRGEHAEHQPAPLREPSGRDDRGHHQRGHAGADADDDAPEQDEMPDLAHRQREQQAAGNQEQSAQDDALQAVTLDQRRRERRHQAEQQDAQGERAGDLFGVPAEFTAERQDQRAGQAHRAGGDEADEKRHGDDRPAVMNAPACEPSRKRLRQHPSVSIAACVKCAMMITIIIVKEPTGCKRPASGRKQADRSPVSFPRTRESSTSRGLSG